MIRDKLKVDYFLDKALEQSILGNYEESEKILEELDDKDPRVVFNLGWHEIRKLQLYSGMEKLIAGRYLNVFGSPPITGKIWKDEPLKDKILLFRCEGGHGDEIINFRFK